MNFYSKIIILTTSILCFSSCMGTDEAELAGKFLPPQVSVGDATISNESITVVLNASYSQNSSSAQIDELGFYYGEDSELASAEKLIASNSTESFSVKVIPNAYGKEYFYKAYLSNGNGEILSSVKSFTMPGFDDFVTLDSPKVITASGNDVSISATISKAEGVTLSEAGIFYSSDSDVSIEDTKVTSNNTETINVEIKGLTTGAKYFMRSYVMDREYIAYSETVEFVPHAVPSVTTVNVSDISYTTAVSGGSSISDNGLDITSKGVVWSTEVNPTIELSTKTENGAGKEDYLADISGLSPGTKYYIRAYAINSDGVGYGNEITFETISQSKASVTTYAPSEVTSSSAMSGGNVTSDGGAEVTDRGVVWSTDHNPTISLDTKTSDGTGVGKFTSAIVGLAPGITYYVRAYVTNSLGTSYGEEVSFTTQAIKAAVTTIEADEITQTSAKVGGNVTATGGAPVTERGIVWGTSQNPTTDNNKVSLGDGLGEFETTLSDLSVATTYYVRAYAINSVGTSYGEEISFTTGSAKPIVTTASPSEVTSSSAISGGNVTTDGGSAVTARGVVWSTDHNPTVSLSTKTSDGTGAGSYVSSITNLEPGTTYYIRAYATNDNGTSYGDEMSFSTNPVKPSVTTSKVTDVTINSAMVGGNVTATGGAAVTERGIVWSTSQNPTINSDKVQVGEGVGEFEITLSDLANNTTYYVRAYAINAAGTSYGEMISFKTKSPMAARIDSNISMDSSSSLIVTVIPEYDGSDNIIVGVVYGHNPNPNFNDNNAQSIGGSSGGPCFISNIEYSQIYYIRPWIQNLTTGEVVLGDQEIKFKYPTPTCIVSVDIPTSLTATSATLTGSLYYNRTDSGENYNVSIDFNPAKEFGIVWGLSEHPEHDDNRWESTSTEFNAKIENLKPNTTYYVRGYALTDYNGFTYGQEILFTTDRHSGNTEGVGNEDFEW